KSTARDLVSIQCKVSCGGLQIFVLTKGSVRRLFCVGLSLLWIGIAASGFLHAAGGHEGQVRVGEAPVPGASVQAIRGETAERTVTDSEGRYSLPHVTDGVWKIRVSAPGFEPIEREFTVTSSPDSAAPVQWDLKMLPIEALQRSTPS